ncbi:hypothetical protein [Paenibacillus sabinae]|uniref:Major facilitator superfamily MFS_1 n=1 Tax=Paenibacillus sabinae T27 TaxID=1268072 RepID=X4Z8W7_9BACL|nr:hypothetical protein [Paenibacillus sabinae]AHV96151.1 major facilitator superfamily MFS_1 [Paenibacillus sabinae T27]
MNTKYRYTLDLQLFSEEDGAVETGAEDVSAAGEQTETPVETQTEDSVNETGVEETAAAEPQKQNNFEKAFAKRLAAEREKWQKETAEKYGDYDTHKELSQYFQQINNTDAITLKERIEMERLQERAEKENTTPEMLKRLDELEAKAAKADELEQQHQQEQINRMFWSAAEKFVDGKGISKEDLNQYMIDNEIFVDMTNPEAAEKKFNMAYKAMKADELQQQLVTAKETAVKEYLQSKSAPRVEGSGTPGVVHEDTSKMSWDEITKRAAARLAAANQST